MAKDRPSSVDEYLATMPYEQARYTLSKLRETIREAIPEAEELIKYGIPTYKHCGFIVSFAAYKNHCSLFPGHTVVDFAEALKGYKCLKGTVQFPPDRPLPEDLVKAMVTARLAENVANAHDLTENSD